jgi:hypothetical protein
VWVCVYMCRSECLCVHVYGPECVCMCMDLSVCVCVYVYLSGMGKQLFNQGRPSGGREECEEWLGS